MTSRERTSRRVGFGFRILSGVIDFIFAVLLALPLSRTLGEWFAGRAVVMLSIGSPDTLWTGPIPMALGAIGELVYVLPLAWLLILMPEIFFGAAAGKWMLGIRILPATSVRLRSDRTPLVAGFVRWVVKCAGLLSMTLALVLGSGVAAVVAFGVSVSVLAGFFVTIQPKSDALHDRLAGTTVVR